MNAKQNFEGTSVRIRRHVYFSLLYDFPFGAALSVKGSHPS
jgi:hypothetical protein